MPFPEPNDLDLMRRVRSIRGTDEALQELPPAADELLASAGRLLLANRHWHAVYLAGYACECDLKYAALRVIGVSITSPAVQSMAGEVKFVLRRRPGVRPEAKHNLLLWAVAVHLRRAEQGRPLYPADRSRLLNVARFVDRVRWVGMRYRPLHARFPDAHSVSQRVYHHTRWLNRRRETLWR